MTEFGVTITKRVTNNAPGLHSKKLRLQNIDKVFTDYHKIHRLFQAESPCFDICIQYFSYQEDNTINIKKLSETHV